MLSGQHQISIVVVSDRPGTTSKGHRYCSRISDSYSALRCTEDLPYCTEIVAGKHNRRALSASVQFDLTRVAAGGGRNGAAGSVPGGTGGSLSNDSSQSWDPAWPPM